MTRDKQARAARRAAERAECELRRLEARKRDAFEQLRDLHDHLRWGTEPPSGMVIPPEIVALFEAADRKPRTVSYIPTAPNERTP